MCDDDDDDDEYTQNSLYGDCRVEFGRMVYINEVQPFQLNSNLFIFQEWKAFAFVRM